MQNELYTPYLGQLAKLAFLASAVHQTVFTMFSTLPFSVGQVKPACLEVKGMSCSNGLLCMYLGTCTILLRIEEAKAKQEYNTTTAYLSSRHQLHLVHGVP